MFVFLVFSANALMEYFLLICREQHSLTSKTECKIMKRNLCTKPNWEKGLISMYFVCTSDFHTLKLKTKPNTHLPHLTSSSKKKMNVPRRMLNWIEHSTSYEIYKDSIKEFISYCYHCNFWEFVMSQWKLVFLRTRRNLCWLFSS